MKGCLTLVGCMACVAFSSVRPLVAADAACQPLTSKAGASIVSYRNLTGHWLIKVVLEQERNSSVQPWHVNVDQNTALCGDAEVTLTTATFTVPLAEPSPDYKLYAGVGYYKFHAEAQTWARAREICALEGAHLAVINSAREAEVAKELFLPFPKISGTDHQQFAWLGVQERGAQQFYTIFGEPLSSTGFDTWSPGEPDDAVDGCVTLQRNTGKLADIACSLKVAFICEQQLYF